MQVVKILVALISLQLIAACSESDEFQLLKLTLHSKTECELIFKAENLSVIENFCNTEQKPILFKLADQEIRSDWIDEETSRFLFQEGCADPGECFYELSASGPNVRGRFSYRINMTEGEYSFEVDESGRSKVLSESSKDVAS